MTKRTMSVRLDDALRARLDRQAEDDDVHAAQLARELIDEGLRVRRHPQIQFRPTPAGGRVPGLVAGPKVVTVIDILEGLDATGDGAVTEASGWLNEDESRIRAVLAYYADHRTEVDDDREGRRRYAERAEAEWRQAQRLAG